MQVLIGVLGTVSISELRFLSLVGGETDMDALEHVNQNPLVV